MHCLLIMLLSAGSLAAQPMLVENRRDHLPRDLSHTTALADVDVDGDGDLDLVGANEEQGIRIYHNLHRHARAPYYAVPGTDYRLDLHAMAAGGKAYAVMIPLLSSHPGSQALPGLGTLQVGTQGLVVLTPHLVDPRVGKATLSIAIPSGTALLGRTFHVQALHVPDLVFPPVRCRLTNALMERVAR